LEILERDRLRLTVGQRESRSRTKS
jgi:hypothetical protein